MATFSTTIPCPICGQPFPPLQLTQHLVATHGTPQVGGGVPQVPGLPQVWLQCPVCRTTFAPTQLVELANHMASHALTGTSVPCPACGKLIALMDLPQHLREHASGIGIPVPCPICGEMVLAREQMKHIFENHVGTIALAVGGLVVLGVVVYAATRD